ncbi:hypothetical protein [Actinomadura madurae]|uniref:hypothetical protein n=1 Tax=Actinomadura madurae TaxID=1993 RepID=UPI000D9103E1|nr:hypothetical protein [Actinomadura madurae]SPT51224.1 Uncharacterised protein [Actinomadura madurae]
MRNKPDLGGVLLDAVGVAMLVAGPVVAFRAGWGRRQIRGELAAQEITFPAESRLPAGLASYA